MTFPQESGHRVTLFLSDEAEIRRRFERELVFSKRLLVRATGHVSGTISYVSWRSSAAVRFRAS